MAFISRRRQLVKQPGTAPGVGGGSLQYPIRGLLSEEEMTLSYTRATSKED